MLFLRAQTEQEELGEEAEEGKMSAEDEITALKARIAELEQQFGFSLQNQMHIAKEWCGKIAMQGAALYKASNTFDAIFRTSTGPDSMRVLAMTGRELCDKALLEAGWPSLEKKPSPPEGPQDQKPRPE